jgi:hypothetical protein
MTRLVPRIPLTYAVIPLANGKGVAVVDIADFELVSQYHWHVKKAPHTNYARRSWWEGGKKHGQNMHQLLTEYIGVDHEDGDGLNNRRSNLRPATGSQNSANRGPRAGGTSKYNGVNWYKRAAKWRAEIRVDGHNERLGHFTDEADAARVYDTAASEAWGEFAWLNCNHFPEIAPH